jgi:hypothetical protein
MTLKKESIDLLTALRSVNWFHAIGQTIESSDVDRVRCWQEALKYCAKALYKGAARIEARNQLTVALSENYATRYQQTYNALVDDINALIVPLIQQKTSFLDSRIKDSEDFQIAVQYDLRGACLELEYTDLIGPIFYLGAIDWYFAGHFPCGWNGRFPKGRLVVF